MNRRLSQARQVLERQQKALLRLSPQARVNRSRQQVDDLTQRMARALSHSLALRRSRLHGLQARLATLSPQATLNRGYAIVQRADIETIVRSVGQVHSGNPLTIRVSDGEFGAVVRGDVATSE